MADWQEFHMDDTNPVNNIHAKEECMASFNQSRLLMHETEAHLVKRCMEQCRSLNSHLKNLSNIDLAGTRSEDGFKRAFSSLFGEDVDIFTNTMFDNVNQLEKQLASEEVHENESKATFRVIKEQFQQFINSWFKLSKTY